ncbi:MAG TPA: hypothetical protein VFG89_02300 [Coriobacteriia bacterium]|nr:hypothetical protein [Coriobacteriia bacterium]
MSLTHHRAKRMDSANAEIIAGSTRSARDGKRAPHVLPMPADTRQRLTDFYRMRDAEDAERFAAGAQSARGSVYSKSLRKLERGEDVFESYAVMAAAGIALTPEAKTMLATLAQDWNRICIVDAQGQVLSASVKQRARSGR